MSAIVVLPESVSCRIAAGEVVQRPASVVKELIDNAIDSGARRISIEITSGGLELIQVTDDGSGMVREDLRLCVERHATSKVRTTDDLDAIGTLGFRGEALAAIASVCILEIQTRRECDVEGSRLRCEGGSPRTVTTCGCPPGTSVKVLRLFHNTPARRKFMKSAQVEFSHITQAVTRFGFAYPEIHFRLDHNGRQRLNLPAVESRQDRLTILLGAENAAEMLPVEGGGKAAQISGFVSRPPLSRNNGNDILTFVNDRFIRDRRILAAIQQAYQSLLPPRSWPVVVLFIEADPAEIDVNVHPSKEEVRFHDESGIFSLVYHAVGSSLRTGLPNREQEQPQTGTHPQTGIMGAIRPPKVSSATDTHVVTTPRAEEISSEEQQLRAQALKGAQAVAGKVLAETPGIPEELEADGFFRDADATRASPSSPDETIRLPGNTGISAGPTPTPPRGSPRVSPPAEPLHSALLARTQLQDSYIIAESAEGLFVVDQHALHERLRFEQIRQQRQSQGIVSQQLLIPHQIAVPPHVADMMETLLPILQRFGFQLEPFGPGCYAAYAIPADLSPDLLGEVLQEIIDDLCADNVPPDVTYREERVMARLACHTAVRAGQALNLVEMQRLLDQWGDSPRLRTCPHGRPPMWSLTWGQVKKLFDR